jgi:electron transport complex protein RnfG
MGARAKEDPSFTAQYQGLPIKEPIKVSGDGGQINALSGATITSRAVSAAAAEACQIYERLKPQLTEKLKAFE